MVKLKLSDYFPNKSSRFADGMAFFSLLLVVVLYIIDILTRWNGYSYDVFTKGQVFLNALKIFGMFALPILITRYIMTRNRNEILSQALLIYIWIIVGVVGIRNIVSFLHLGVSILLFFILKNSAEDPVNFQFTIIFLTLFDFFGFYLLGQLNGPLNITSWQLTRLAIPIWIYFVLVFAQQHNGAPMFNWIFFIILFINLGMILSSSIGIYATNFSAEKIDQQIIIAWLKDFKNVFKITNNPFLQLWNNAFNYSYVDYSGTQEKTEEPQGVYLEQIDTGRDTFREGDPVYVWAKLKAKTLDGVDGVLNVKVNCFTVAKTPSGDETIIGIVDENGGEEVILEVTSGVERSIPCIFDAEYGNELPADDYRITFNVEFDFAADVRKKVYMMNRYRYINDIELLDEKGMEPSKDNVLRELYKIDDVEPESISSSGPVLLAIGTDTVPWDIPETKPINTLFGLTIKNNWNQGGRIRKANKVEMIVPETFSIIENSCDLEATKTSTEDEFAFYLLTPRRGDTIENIEEFRTTNCIISVDSKSLDNIPVTTRFLKAHIEYTYLFEEEISVEVEEYSYGTEEEAVERQTEVCCKYTSQTQTPGVYRITYGWGEGSECRLYTGVAGHTVSVDFCEKMCCRTGTSEYILVMDQADCDEKSTARPNLILNEEEKYKCET